MISQSLQRDPQESILDLSHRNHTTDARYAGSIILRLSSVANEAEMQMVDEGGTMV